MKILIINSVCGIRSTGRIVTDIAEKFIVDGHDVKIAYGREMVSEQYLPISYRIGNDVDVKINALKSRIFDNEGFNAVKQTKKFIKWAEEYDPDILWLHNLHGYYLNVKLLFEWIKMRPLMEVRWTLHDCWAFTGHCSYFSYVKCDKWKYTCAECPQKHSYPKSAIFDRSTINYIRKLETFCKVPNMKLITPSKWLRKLVKESFLSEYPVEVINNVIDDAVFKPTSGDFRKRFDLCNKKVVLGVASVWDKRKGFQDYLKLSQLLGHTYVIVLVGLTYKQMRQLPQNIIGIHRTESPSQLAEIYTAADVFVNLTYEDNYPTVNLESQACGTICLTYRTGGSVESVPPECVVEQGDVFAMAEMIEKVCAGK